MAEIGRPSKYKPEFCAMLVEHGKEGLSFEAFAGVVEVSVQTLYTWAKEHPEFLEAKSVAKALQTAFWERLATKGAGGKVENFSASMTIFALKNIAGWRDNLDLQHAGKPGAPIGVEYDMSRLTSDKLEQLVEIVSAAKKGK